MEQILSCGRLRGVEQTPGEVRRGASLALEATTHGGR